jgi:hypothetical protein
MRFIAILLTLSCVASAGAQNIGTKTLSPGAATRILLSPSLTTTLLLPGQPAGVFGLGLVNGQSNLGGSVQIDHPDGSNVLVLRALTDNAHVIATVLLDGALYVLALESSSTPDVALTLVKAGSSQDSAAAPRAQPVTPEEIVAARPKYDPEILISLLRRARDNQILAPIYHDLYQGYSRRDAQCTSENPGVYKTTVTTIHRFSKEDAVVLQGVCENLTDKPLVFDGRAVTVQVANEVHPSKLTDCLRPIPAHAKTLIDVVLQGDVDGGRANLSIENEFRIMLPIASPIWSLKNGGDTPKGGFKVPVPIKPSPVPLTQTGTTKKDAQ